MSRIVNRLWTRPQFVNSGKRISRKSRHSMLRLQRLEDRTTPTTFIVLNNFDAGPDSLRDCVSKANGMAGTDTIKFDPAVVGMITLTTGELPINETVDITGPGAGVLTVSGNNASRIFNTTGAPAASAINISGLTLTAGKGDEGGAIRSKDEQLGLTSCVLTGNTASNFGGGAIGIDAGLFNATNCSFLNNTAPNYAGAIDCFGTAKAMIRSCTISGNSASSAGGIFARNYLFILDSTISGNIATGAFVTGNGGGIRAEGYFPGGALTIRNSTISGNNAAVDGGGIGLTSFYGTLNVQNSTITKNTATGKGGGIAVPSGTGNVSIESTVLQDNTAPIGTDANTPVPPAPNSLSAKNSAIGSIVGIGTFTNLGGNLIGDPNIKLSPLQNNGGPTLTHIPMAGSSLVDKGSLPFLLMTDQRGLNRVVNGTADIGSVEINPLILVVDIITDEDDGNTSPGDLSLREAIGLANAFPGTSDVINFSPLFAVPQSIVLNLPTEISIAGPVTVSGTGSDLLTVSGNNAHRIFNTTSAAAGTAIRLSGMTLKNGSSTLGGAIQAGDESLILVSCVLTANKSTANAGAVGMTGKASLSGSGCTFSNNTAASFGGAIAHLVGSGATTFLTQCTLSGNTAASGGAIYANNYLYLSRCAVTDNTTTGGVGVGFGGGIRVAGAFGAGALTIINSTISGNTTAADGGGIVLTGVTGTLVVRNTTIAFNTAGNKGGGIAANTVNPAVSLESSIVSKNTNAAAPDISHPAPAPGAVTAKNCNIFSAVGFILNPASVANQLGVDPMLGMLADNGGASKTHELLAGSPCINAGTNPAGLTIDQRGPGYPRVTNGAPDMGAYETRAVFTVTNTKDAGAGSLRQAIIDANTLGPSNDLIVFSALFNVAQIITLTTGEIAIADEVEIQGKGDQLTTVSGNGFSRIFNTSTSPSAASISISGLTLTAGRTGGDGGAIFIEKEAVALTNCTVTNSKASSDGGAIFVLGNGSLTLQSTTISGNNSVNQGGAAYFFDGGRFTIRDSTISGNMSGKTGGGITFYGAATGALLVSNSTFSGNLAGDSGGGIALLAFAGDLKLQNSTMTQNAADDGGGIRLVNVSGSYTISIESTIVSGNFATGIGPDIMGAIVSLKTSAIGSSNGFIPIDMGGNLPYNINLKLGPLQLNGGPTETHALLAGSPAVDKGSNPGLLTNDQRGPTYLRVVNLPDIGAYETPKVFVVTNTKDAGVGSLRQAVLDANANVGVADLIRFDPTVFNVFQPIILLTGEMKVTDSVEIQGTGKDLLLVSGNGGGRIFNVSGPGKFDFQVNGMTLTKGAAAGDGGAIFDLDETLILRDCVISGSVASANGGGIGVYGIGHLILERCSLATNAATSDGGGFYFYNGGSFFIKDTIISGNSANGAGDDGGGGYFFGDLTGPGIIRNSTFSGNKSLVTGGGLALRNFGTVSNVPVVVQNSTFTLNTASGAGGGGIARASGIGTISLQSTVVAQNTNAVSSDIWFNAFTNVPANNNVIGSANTGNFGLVGLFNQTGTQAAPLNAMLWPLGNFGGPTLTHFPQAGSPVIDNGINLANLEFDQRGFDRVFNIKADVGSVEVNPMNLVVDITADELDGNFNVGDLSLREAIALANASAATNDTVTFSPTVFATTKTLTLLLGEIPISGQVIVQGPAAKVTVSGNNASRIFDTSSAPAGAAINISNMTMTLGKPGGNGGAILGFDEAILLTNCALTNNTGANGGGVNISGDGSFTATNCTFTNNAATGSFGAIDVFGPASTAKTILRGCTLSGNKGSNGGALYAEGFLLIENSTISGNTATIGGAGGLLLAGTFPAGGLTIRNSTISTNTATTDGGGIWLFGVTGTLVVENTTITKNTATGKGGGIASTAAGTLITLASSIVSQNNNAAAPDISHPAPAPGAVTATKCSILSPVGFILNPASAGNRPFGEDPQLGMLQNNGGPTFTHMPSSASPVLNNGSNPSGIGFDQRGTARQSGSGVDMGAVERQNGTTFVVDTTVDESDGNFVPGDFSLREAVETANLSLESADTVTFDAVVFGTTKTIALTLGEIPISTPMTIDGITVSSANTVVVSGSNASRIFNTSSSPIGTVISLSELTLVNGKAAGFGGAILGGDEVLTISNSRLSGNLAALAGGGAVAVIGSGVFRAVNSTFSNNSAAGFGGALDIFNGAKTIIEQCTLSGNIADTAGAFYASTYLRMVDSTVSGNSATDPGFGLGGGMVLSGAFAGGALSIRNSTISGNTSTLDGGGIWLYYVTGTLVVQNTTIAKNTALGVGGGIAANSKYPLISLESSIVSLNTNGAAPDISHPAMAPGAVTAKNSSIFSNVGFILNPGSAGNRPFFEDPMLLPLANYGGPTATHALKVGSPVVNKGSNPAPALANDQRGPGFARVVGSAPDMGAYEIQPPPCVVGNTVIINGGDVQRSRVTKVEVHFDQVVTIPAMPETAFELRRQSDGLLVALTANVLNNTATHVTLTFNGALSEFKSLEDGRYTLTIFNTKVSNLNGNLDGNCDGTGGDDFVLASAGTTGIFRLFGDGNGTANVDSVDFALFRTVFGIAGPPFDFDNNGVVNSTDFAEFRKRFGIALP